MPKLSAVVVPKAVQLAFLGDHQCMLRAVTYVDLGNHLSIQQCNLLCLFHRCIGGHTTLPIVVVANCKHLSFLRQKNSVFVPSACLHEPIAVKIINMHECFPRGLGQCRITHKHHTQLVVHILPTSMHRGRAGLINHRGHGRTNLRNRLRAWLSLRLSFPQHLKDLEREI